MGPCPGSQGGPGPGRRPLPAPGGPPMLRTIGEVCGEIFFWKRMHAHDSAIPRQGLWDLDSGGVMS